jgi:hypothetical protein
MSTSAKKRNRALRAAGASSLNRVCAAMWLEGSAIGPVLVDHRMTDNGERVIVLKLDQLDGDQKAVLKKIGLWSNGGVKRWRIPKQKPNTLEAKWAKPDKWSNPDLTYVWGAGCASADAHLLHNVLTGERYPHPLNGTKPDSSLTAELEKRGYDLTTLRFSISKPNPTKQPDDSTGAADSASAALTDQIGEVTEMMGVKTATSA